MEYPAAGFVHSPRVLEVTRGTRLSAPVWCLIVTAFVLTCAAILAFEYPDVAARIIATLRARLG